MSITFKEIRQREQSGDYKNKAEYPTCKAFPDNYVWDEDQSVRWNREEVAKYNAVVKQEMEHYCAADAIASKLFQDEITASIAKDCSIPVDSAVYIYRYAYEQGHSYGHYEVIVYAEKLCELIRDVMNSL